ncbi:MAG: hypothetical protein KY445_17400, partial [Armatimonadetes bacterium]|nr:hypothetical protein [Armatimonadota bacterium]
MKIGSFALGWFWLLSGLGVAAPVSPSRAYTFDARPLRKLDLNQGRNAAKVWDTLHLLTALQGLANRRTPQFYLFYNHEFGVDTDEFWFRWFKGEDGWLRRTKVDPLSEIDDALHIFRGSFHGLVVYDPRVPATSNVASTASGCDALLPVRFDVSPDSLYIHLTQKLRLPVRLWLVN